MPSVRAEDDAIPFHGNYIRYTERCPGSRAGARRGRGDRVYAPGRIDKVIAFAGITDRPSHARAESRPSGGQALVDGERARPQQPQTQRHPFQLALAQDGPEPEGELVLEDGECLSQLLLPCLGELEQR